MKIELEVPVEEAFLLCVFIAKTLNPDSSFEITEAGKVVVGKITQTILNQVARHGPIRKE